MAKQQEAMMSDELVERLKSSAKAFRDNPVYDSEGGGVFLVIQADELDEAVDRISSLTQQVETLTAERDALSQFGGRIFKYLFEQFCEGGYEIEIHDLIMVDAVKCGLVEKTAFDPEQHTDEFGDSQAGDDWFQATDAGRAALKEIDHAG